MKGNGMKWYQYGLREQPNNVMEDEVDGIIQRGQCQDRRPRSCDEISVSCGNISNVTMSCGGKTTCWCLA